MERGFRGEVERLSYARADRLSPRGGAVFDLALRLRDRAPPLLLLTGYAFNRDLTLSMGTKAPDPSLVPVMLSFLMIFFAPLLTMRLFAEERREGTLELLLTAPVRDGSIVFGKFMGAWFYYSLLLALTFLYQFVLMAITAA